MTNMTHVVSYPKIIKSKTQHMSISLNYSSTEVRISALLKLLYNIKNMSVLLGFEAIFAYCIALYSSAAHHPSLFIGFRCLKFGLASTLNFALCLGIIFNIALLFSGHCAFVDGSALKPGQN